MADKKHMSSKWPSSASAFDGKVQVNLNVDEAQDPVQIEMTPMQAMEMGLQLIDRARHCLKSVLTN